MNKYKFPKNVEICKHKNHISQGDAGYCPDCGQEDTVYGMFFWIEQAKPIVERFYRGEISHSEVARLLDSIGGVDKWRMLPTSTR